jgi:hypothetical protein
MIAERIAIVDLADELQVRKQRIFKLLPRLGIRASQRREANRGNQNVATVTIEEAAVIRKDLATSIQTVGEGVLQLSGASSSPSFSDDVGYFYVIQLEPDHDPGRFKVGFTTELDGRLQKHRCSAPFARYLKSWPCRRVWERAAIDCVTDGCERIHTEVFRTASLDIAAGRAGTFFSVMPALLSTIGEAEGEPLEDEPADPAMQPTGSARG